MHRNLLQQVAQQAALVLAVGAGCACSDSGPKSCGSNPASYSPRISPADFPNPTRIDNRFSPLVPGTVFNYRATDGKILESTVTFDTKVVMGITTVVVHDLEKSADGTVSEDTYDWYAQDKDGNVWYFGEDTKAFAAGIVSTKGSWEAGVDCAQPGYLMKADPRVGDSYRQEYSVGVAEDRADVLSLNEYVTVPFGSFQSCLQTRDVNDLEPGKVEHKHYCAGVGFVSAVDIVMVGTGNREELISITRPAP